MNKKGLRVDLFLGIVGALLLSIAVLQVFYFSQIENVMSGGAVKIDSSKCKINDSKNYTCLAGQNILWCNCINSKWDCIDDPEFQCDKLK